jgi:putative ABC transport system permease protein
MKTFDLFALYRREMKPQRRKMRLTLLALAWGTLSVVVLLAFGAGLEAQMRKSMHGLGEGIIIMGGGQTSKPYQGLGKGRRIGLAEEDIDLIKRGVSGIALISPESERYGISLTRGRRTFTARVTGVAPDFGELRTYYPERGGRFLDEPDVRNKRRVVFLGSELKKKLFDDENAVGEAILIAGTPFLVVGEMRPKFQNSMYNGPDVEKAAIPYSVYRALFGQRQVDRVIYKAADKARTPEVRDAVHRVLARKYKFDSTDKQALNVWDTIEDEALTLKIFAGIRIFMGIIGGMTLFVAGVGVANIMYVSAKRRTREIGIKMALGAKRRHILAQFITEAVWLSFAGGAGGVLASFALVAAVRTLPAEGEAANMLLRPIISVDIMILTALILGAVGFLAGFFPAKRAAALDPVTALRYE